MLLLPGSPYNIGQGFTVNANGSVELAKNMPATTNYGLLSIGQGPWDGNSGGHFVGSANGQLLALASAMPAESYFIIAQNSGTTEFSVRNDGLIAAPYFSDINNNRSLLQTNSTPSFRFSAVDNTLITLQIMNVAGQTADIFQTISPTFSLLSGIRADGLIYSTINALATKEKAGAPVDGDWTVTPPDGTIVIDSTNSKLWAKVGGVWKGVAIA